MNQQERTAVQQMRDAEIRLDAYLSQYSDDEQERILQYAIDHVLPKYKGRRKATADRLLAEPQEQSGVGGDCIEWLCVRCRCVHPVQKKNSILQPCPTCKTTMTPTSFNLRRIDTLEQQVSSQTAEIERLTAANEDLEAEVDEAQRGPWPDWAEAILKCVRSRSGYDGYYDQDGVDLPGEVEEHFQEVEAMANRAIAQRNALQAKLDAAAKTKPVFEYVGVGKVKPIGGPYAQPGCKLYLAPIPSPDTQAAIDRKDALLREALKALNNIYGTGVDDNTLDPDSPTWKAIEAEEDTIIRFTKELEQRRD